MTRPTLITILALLAGAAPAAMAQVQPPNTRVLDCINGGCHTPIMSYPVMHGPTAIAACDACHDYADPATHTFVNKRTGSAVCSFCHVGADTQLGPIVHQPFADGQCTGCHNPHGSTDKRFLKAGLLSEQCFQCHTETVVGSHVHKPVAEGDCLGCHMPHSADFAHLLKIPGESLCLTCHEQISQRIDSAIVVHDPITTGSCTDCHDAHASDTPSQLVMPPSQLCVSCHEQVELDASQATFRHSPLFDERSCLNCHQPHAGPHAALLMDDPVAACLACHDKPIERQDGRTVASVAEIAARGMHPHGPLAEQRCSGCHLPHGAEHSRLLTANYTTNFYEPFSLEHYALCFQCHDQKLALEATTEGTGFRNGDRNLHFVHVNTEKDGRACRTCHTIHVSKATKQIAETVPYGQWKLPLNYLPTPTGGSCNAGCHRLATYDRLNATPGISAPIPAEQAPTPKPAGPGEADADDQSSG